MLPFLEIIPTINLYKLGENNNSKQKYYGGDRFDGFNFMDFHSFNPERVLHSINQIG